MNFEVLKRSHVKRNIVIAVIIILILSAIILTFTKAKYKTTASIPLVNGTINYDLSDLNLIGVYIQEGEEYIQTNEIPSSGYEFNSEKSYCTVNNENIDVTLNYDIETQNLTVTPLTKKGTKCYLYFDEASSATDVIEDTYEENQGMLAYDNTVDNNLRYIGANPNNYVYFNCADYNNPSSSTCELWRIIGIFNENSHGISGEKLIKIIRSNSLGNIAWDSADTNNWSTASLQKTLNGDYLNGSGSYASIGIKNDTTRNMIANVTWKLGGSSTYDDVTASMLYERERGTTVDSGRPTTWQGEIALMYPSDYGYATSGGSTTNRETCLVKKLFVDWYESNYNDCKNNDWLLDSSISQWTLTPRSSISTTVFVVYGNGAVGGDDGAYYSYGVRPSLYLSSNVSIISGDGTQSSPYTLSN